MLNPIVFNVYLSVAGSGPQLKESFRPYYAFCRTEYHVWSTTRLVDLMLKS